MGRLIPLLFLIEVVLVAAALISCLSAEEGDIRTLPRPAWIFIILLFPLIGAVAWFSAGRPLPATDRIGIGELGSRFGSGFGGTRPERPRPPRRPVAPDDDPEFLRSLDVDQARRDREMFRRWEDDLRRRDDDTRRGKSDPADPDDTPP